MYINQEMFHNFEFFFFIHTLKSKLLFLKFYNELGN